jgi:hypothetical protein
LPQVRGNERTWALLHTPFVPAEAGTQNPYSESQISLDSRLRGNERGDGHCPKCAGMNGRRRCYILRSSPRRIPTRNLKSLWIPACAGMNGVCDRRRLLHRSSPRKRGPRIPTRNLKSLWIPACAGTNGDSAYGRLHIGQAALNMQTSIIPFVPANAGTQGHKPWRSLCTSSRADVTARSMWG